MMTTFGDGPKPKSETIQAALMGTRKCLQVAIMDARAVRRRAKKSFDEARKAVASKGGGDKQSQVDASTQYRAMVGHDRLSLQPKCGFDMEQLTWLFPEEMRAYKRWNDMHTEYQNAKDEMKTNDTECTDGEEKSKDEDAEDSSEPVGGHLKERAAHFDSRTQEMKDEWYIRFSKVRQGSFLQRGSRARKTESESKWEAHRKSKRGRREAGIWENVPANSVRFLHWLGFEPPTIYPPNEETTQALGFLGHDILGRIVEKVNIRPFHFYN